MDFDFICFVCETFSLDYGQVYRICIFFCPNVIWIHKKKLDTYLISSFWFMVQVTFIFRKIEGTKFDKVLKPYFFPLLFHPVDIVDPIFDIVFVL